MSMIKYLLEHNTEFAINLLNIIDDGNEMSPKILLLW